MKIVPPPQDNCSSGKAQLSPAKQAPLSRAFVSVETRAGEVFKGTVLSVDAQGVVTIETEAGQISAKPLTPMSVGDQIMVQVVKAGDLPFIAAISGSAGKGVLPDVLRVLIPWLKPDSVNFQAMPATVQGEPQAHDSDRQFARLLAQNSVGSEPDPLQQVKISALVSSLKKGAALPETVQKFLGLAESGSLKEVSLPELKKMAQLLEAHGLLAAKDSAGPQPTVSAGQRLDFFLFPCFFANSAGSGEWMCSFEQSGSTQQERRYSVAFYLAMSQLGDVHLQLHLDKRSLTGVFTLESDAAASHMRNQLNDLRERLQPLFGNSAFTCRTASQKAIERLKIDLQQKSGLAEFALIDLTA